MGLFSSDRQPDESSKPEETPARLTVQVMGPQGVVETFVFVDDGQISIEDDSIDGNTPDGKQVYVAGLGGAFCAIIKEQ